MTRFIVFTIVFFTGLGVHSQKFGQKRIDRLKNTVVRVFIDGKQQGTGFVISKNGLIATCYHVVEPAIKRDEETKEAISISDSIYVQFENNNKINVSLIEQFVYDDEWAEDGITEDYVFLAPIESTSREFEYLELGTWDDVNEGDEIYISGFPLSASHIITARGMVSTKFKRKMNPENINGNKVYEIDAAFIDVTANNGNSGGPVIKLERNYRRDKVVGLVSFKLIRNAKAYTYNSEYYLNRYKKTKNKDVRNIEMSLGLLFNAVVTSSFGVGGAVSIDGSVGKLEQLNH